MEEKREKKNINFNKIFGLDKNSEDGNEKHKEDECNENDPNKEKDKKNSVNPKKKSFINSTDPSNFVILLMVGILLLIISWPSTNQDDKNTIENNTKENTAENLGETPSNIKNGNQLYASDLEERLEEALRKVEGLGEVEVMITLKGSKEVIVLKDEPFKEERLNESDGEGGKRITSNYDQEENTILIENEDGSKTPYVLKELEPQVEGILVIAQGGNNSEIINQIIEATQVLFGVPEHKVKVMKMN